MTFDHILPHCVVVQIVINHTELVIYSLYYIFLPRGHPAGRGLTMSILVEFCSVLFSIPNDIVFPLQLSDEMKRRFGILNFH